MYVLLWIEPKPGNILTRKTFLVEKGNILDDKSQKLDYSWGLLLCDL